MKIYFLGTKASIDPQSKTHRNNSCLLVKSERKSLLIDFGKTWKGHYKKFEKKVDYMLLTHTHDDHIGGVPTHPKIPIYVPFIITKKLLAKSNVNVVDYNRITLGDFDIQYVPVIHSLSHPTFAIRITSVKSGKTIFYAPDVVSIPKKWTFSDADIYIGDGTTPMFPQQHGNKDIIESVQGHATIMQQLFWLQNVGVRRAVFTHFGFWTLNPKFEKTILEKMRQRFPQIKIDFAYDGMKVNL